MKLARWPTRQVPSAEVLNLKKPYLELQMKRMELVKRSLGRCSHLDETVSTLFLVFKVNLLSVDLFCFFLHFLVILLFQVDCLNSNVRGERIFSCNGGRLVLWKVRLNWESGGCETGAFKKKRISTGNHFEEDFYPDELWRRRISSGLIHVGPNIICV